MKNKMWLETWDEMNARHDRERREALQTLSDSGYTQTEAAAILRRSVSFINTYIHRYGINWKEKRQGGRPHVEK